MVNFSLFTTSNHAHATSEILLGVVASETWYKQSFREQAQRHPPSVPSIRRMALHLCAGRAAYAAPRLVRKIYRPTYNLLLTKARI